LVLFRRIGLCAAGLPGPKGAARRLDLVIRLTLILPLSRIYIPAETYRCTGPLPIKRIDRPKYDTQSKLFFDPFSLRLCDSSVGRSEQGWGKSTRVFDSFLRLSDFFGHVTTPKGSAVNGAKIYLSAIRVSR
jgi:hypothetical protein